MKQTDTVEGKTLDVKLSSNQLTSTMINALGRALRKQGYKYLTFTTEPIMGAWLTIDLETDL